MTDCAHYALLNMQSTLTSPSPRDEVLRRIGRNVVNFQYLEATLRSMIPSLANEGTLKDWQANLTATTRKHRKSSLGDLAGSFLERVFSGAEGPLADADESLREIKFRFSLQLDATPEQEAEHRKASLSWFVRGIDSSIETLWILI